MPGDALEIKVPSRDCDCRVIVHVVEIAACDLPGDGSQYKITFANEAAQPLAVQTTPATAQELSGIDLLQLANPTWILPALTLADLIDVSSTTLTFDMGVDPPRGGGFEVRYSDSGWDPAIDRNLAARFTTRVFTIPRLSRVQSYFMRQSRQFESGEVLEMLSADACGLPLMTNFEERVLADLSELKTNMRWVVGDGPTDACTNWKAGFRSTKRSCRGPVDWEH